MSTKACVLANVFVVLFCSHCLMGQQQTVLSGTLLGYDGKPMSKAHVHITALIQGKVLTSAEAASDGSFKLATDERGFLMIQFTGVNHLMYEVPLLIEKPLSVRLDVRLSTYDYVDDFGGVKIIGDFNNFSPRSGRFMNKQPDGTYSSEFQSAAERFSYQLLGIEKTGRSINGTQSEDFVYDGGGDYHSVVRPKDGKVKIVFDPMKLVRSDSKAQVHFEDTNSVQSRFASIYAERQKRQASFSDAVKAHRQAEKDIKDFAYDWSADVTNLSKWIREEKEPLLRQALLLSYLELGSMGAKNLDSTTAQRAFAEIPPTSPLWSLNPSLAHFRASRQADESEKYIEEVIDHHPDPAVKLEGLYYMLNEAFTSGDTAKGTKYYNRLVTEYGDTPLGKYVKSRFARNRVIMVGKSVPAFSVVSLGDSTKRYTRESFKGTTYLLDFWATWCGPCIAEMENLHKAYEKFKSRNLQILSLSFDATPQDVITFRQGKWKMPWLHAFVAGGFDDELAKQFEVVGIPKPILVDAAGQIVATEMDLRGENLEKTLTHILGETK
jgi:thiol-disulfide isomerase/thioredoxin